MKLPKSAGEPPDLVRTENLSKSFAGVHALHSVSLSIRAAEIHGLVGENGSGKSTLIKILSGVIAPDSGRIELDGRSLRRLNPRQAIRFGIQVIYQDFSLFPNLTVAENIALNTELADGTILVNRARIRKLALRGVEQMGVELDLDSLVETIPVSHWQLVAITRALVQNARLIIMDEPTTALTRREVDALIKVIRRLKKIGISTLFVGHKLDEVVEIADTISVLRNGELAARFGPEEFSPGRIAESMTGRAPEVRTRKGRCGTPPLLRVDRLTRAAAFVDVSFELRVGEVLGFTGLLGSGQTELAHALFGLVPHDSGRIVVEGKELRQTGVRAAARAGLAYVPEDRLRFGLFPDHSIAQNLLVALVGRMSGLSILWPNELRRIASGWTSRLNIKTPSIALPVKSLSGGNQQRVVIGRWLATDPRILILNNPTAGVDIGAKQEIHRLLDSLAQRGCGIILISDDLPELLENCHRILLMGRGAVTSEFRTDEIVESDLIRAITGGGGPK